MLPRIRRGISDSGRAFGDQRGARSRRRCAHRNASLHRCLRRIPFRMTVSHGSVVGAARCNRARETAPRNVLLVLLGWCLAQMSFHARRQDSPLALLSSFKLFLIAIAICGCRFGMSSA